MGRCAVTFVVMAGGKGERLWPLVRTTVPKVCLSINGKRSLLQATIDRFRPTWPRANWLIVTTQEQAKHIRANLPRQLRSAVLVEPQGKNTAACITLAAAVVATQSPDRVLIVTPADHWVGNLSLFQRTIQTAIHVALKEQTIVTIGIPPTHAHSGLGYLCAQESVRCLRCVHVLRLARFVEKPSQEIARRLFKQPRTFWNSGVFIGTADKFLECVAELLPEHARKLIPLAIGYGTRSWMHRAKAAYQALQAVSFDAGVMTYLRDGIVVEGNYPWTDLGSWDAWVQLNHRRSDTVAVESRNVVVVSQEKHLVATIGLRDALVVHTPLATLICSSKKTQAVRKIVSKLSKTPRLASYR